MISRNLTMIPGLGEQGSVVMKFTQMDCILKKTFTVIDHMFFHVCFHETMDVSMKNPMGIFPSKKRPSWCRPRSSSDDRRAAAPLYLGNTLGPWEMLENHRKTIGKWWFNGI